MNLVVLGWWVCLINLGGMLLGAYLSGGLCYEEHTLLGLLVRKPSIGVCYKEHTFHMGYAIRSIPFWDFWVVIGGGDQKIDYVYK